VKWFFVIKYTIKIATVSIYSETLYRT